MISLTQLNLTHHIKIICVHLFVCLHITSQRVTIDLIFCRNLRHYRYQNCGGNYWLKNLSVIIRTYEQNILKYTSSVFSVLFLYLQSTFLFKILKSLYDKSTFLFKLFSQIRGKILMKAWAIKVYKNIPNVEANSFYTRLFGQCFLMLRKLRVQCS